jgi:phosphodiesterase/alkaline phosphatase D-like protein
VLRGVLNPLAAGEAGTYDFTYEQSGSVCAAGLTAPEPAGGASGALEEVVETPVSDLEPNREYTFCVVAFNGADESSASVPWTFKTLAVKPALTGVRAEGVTATGARLEAMVNPENEPTTCEFEYGTTPSYGSRAPCEGPATLEGFSEQGVGLSLGYLQPGTKYDFRVLVSNATGSEAGTGEFTTAMLAAPTVVEASAAATATSATVTAQINPGYQTTKYSVEYSGSESGGVLQPPVTTVEGTTHLNADGGVQEAKVSTGPVLAPGHTYYYRVVAVNGTSPATNGAVQPFTTVPAASTGAPTAVTATTATFNGVLAPLNAEVAAQYSFSYSLGGECANANATAVEEAGTGAGSVPESANVTELEPNAAYTVCFVTSNAFGSQQGQAVPFTTLKSPPTIEVEAAGAPSPFEAVMEAVINPNNEATSYAFEYSSSESVGVLQPPVTTVKGTDVIPAGYGGQPASAVTGPALQASTTYYYRVVAENGTDPAAEETVANFVTPAALAPVIDSENAVAVSGGSETLEAEINTGYQATSYSFQYAEKETTLLKDEGTPLPAMALPAGNITTGPGEHATTTVTGLTPNTRYYYRVMASNATGAARNLPSVARFTSSSVPSASTLPAAGFTPASVTLAGRIDPDGLATSYYFQYGGTSAYGDQTPPTPAGEGTSTATYSTLVSNLEPGRTYHYRIVATNENDGALQTAYGQDETFTMPSTPPALSAISVTGITENTATITAQLDPQGLPTRYELQAGPTPALLTPQASGDTSSTTLTPIALAASALSPGTVYYYRLTASNPDGTAETTGAFTTTTTPTTPTTTTTPTIVPYTTITAIDAKETKENKPPKPPTRHQRLLKALKTCKTIKNKHKRATCNKQAHHKYAPTKTKH